MLVTKHLLIFTMNTRRFWRKNKATVIFGALAIASLALNLGDIKHNMDSMSKMKADIESQANAQTKLELGEEAIAAQSKVANARLERGCIPVIDTLTRVVEGIEYVDLVPLQPGEPVLDRKNKSNLVAGTCVVGANGETSILENNVSGVPVAANLAVGGSHQLVLANVRRIAGSEAKVYWNTPTINNK